MKNAKSAKFLPGETSRFLGKKINYFQLDHKVKNIFEIEGVKVLSSPKAFEKYPWTRKLFGRKPKEGYFVWVQKQVDFPLTTCVAVATPEIYQDLTNLLVIEKNIKAKARVVCLANFGNLHLKHRAQGKMILKDNASLEYIHFHHWGEKDFVSPDYEFLLGKNSKLVYTYKNLLPPENLHLKTGVHCGENSSVQLNFAVNGLNSKIKIEDTIWLQGKNSQGIARLRLAAKDKSQITAVSKIIAKNQGKGHLDCRGLLIADDAKINLIPQVICENKNAQITHEASIGKISEEELTYLRMRGLTEKEAIDLIVGGFLKL